MSTKTKTPFRNIFMETDRVIDISRPKGTKEKGYQYRISSKRENHQTKSRFFPKPLDERYENEVEF